MMVETHTRDTRKEKTMYYDKIGQKHISIFRVSIEELERLLCFGDNHIINIKWRGEHEGLVLDITTSGPDCLIIAEQNIVAIEPLRALRERQKDLNA